MPLIELFGGIGVGLVVACIAWLAMTYISPHVPCKASVYYGRTGITYGVIGAALIAVFLTINHNGLLDIDIALPLTFFLIFLLVFCPTFAAVGWLWGRFSGNVLITPKRATTENQSPQEGTVRVGSKQRGKVGNRAVIAALVAVSVVMLAIFIHDVKTPTSNNTNQIKSQNLTSEAPNPGVEHPLWEQETMLRRQEVLYQKVAQLYEAGHWQDLLEVTTNQLISTPIDHVLLNYKGLALLSLGRPSQAYIEFLKASRLDPAEPVYALNTGVAAYETGGLGLAKKFFNKTLQLNPHEKMAQGWLVAIERELIQQRTTQERELIQQRTTRSHEATPSRTKAPQCIGNTKADRMRCSLDPAENKCQIKPVMSGEDFRACGINPATP